MAGRNKRYDKGFSSIMMRHFLRFFGWLFSLACILGAVAAALVGLVIWRFSEQLPDYSQLATYQPAVTTRIHAADGSLLAEYSRERRLFLPNDAIPERVKQAFIAAEDKNFYKHPGVDIEGVARAAVYFFKRDSGKRPQGASTITQQVAKNFLLSSETSFSRKIKEMLVALRMEEAYSKERILELYLNEIYLGLSNYGVAAAALNYFGKGVNELNLQEVAYLAALPKGPNNYHPYRKTQAAIERRNYVLQQMEENGYITAEQRTAAAAAVAWKNPLTAAERARADKRIESETLWLRQGISARRRRNQGRLERLFDMRKERAQRQNLRLAKLGAVEAKSGGHIVAELEGVAKAFPGESGPKTILKGFSTRIVRGDRIGIIGGNGVGKSTLLGIITINFAVVQFAPGGPVEQMMAELKGKVVLITGPAKGMGAAITKAFAVEGSRLALMENCCLRGCSIQAAGILCNSHNV